MMLKQPYGRRYAASFYQDKTTIRISENMIYPQFVKRLSEFRTELRNGFGPGGFDAFRPPVQEALFDLAWNTGGNIRKNFPDMWAAIVKCRGWLLAADESHRDTRFVDEDRNIEIKKSILEAINFDRRR